MATLGIAVASPLVNPQQLHVVCTEMGLVKLVVADRDAGEPSGPGRHTLDCPACLSVTPHPPSGHVDAPLPVPRPHALHPFVAAHLAWATGAPLPPRGQPAS